MRPTVQEVLVTLVVPSPGEHSEKPRNPQNPRQPDDIRYEILEMIGVPFA